MERELRNLLASARRQDLSPAEFDARLETLHTVFSGEDANSAELAARRRAASKVYEELTSGIDQHHNIERLAELLGVDVASS